MAQPRTFAPTYVNKEESVPRPQRSVLLTVSLQVLLLVAGLVAVIPTVYMVLTSLKTSAQYGVDTIGLPAPFTLENYAAIFAQHPFLTWMLNSALLSVGSVLLSTIIAAMGAYAIARMRFVGREILLALSTSLMAVPPGVMIVPLFVLFSQIKLLGTYQGVILIYAGLLTPFSVYLLVTFFRTIPLELIEAALIDGATTFGILFRIILPLSGPPLVTLFIVNLLYVWNDLLIALLFLPDERLRTLMVGVSAFQGRYLQNIPLSMAGMVLASLPMFAVYMFFQRFFIRGMVAGAIKG